MQRNNGAGGSRTHVQTPANIFVYNHRLCISLTVPRHITQALKLRVYQSLIKPLDKTWSYLANNKTCHWTRAIQIGSRLLVFKQLERKKCYFLQLYLTERLRRHTSRKICLIMPVESVTTPKDNKTIIPHLTQKCKKEIN